MAGGSPADVLRSAVYWEHVVYAVVLAAATAAISAFTLVTAGFAPYVHAALAVPVMLFAVLPLVGVLAAYADLPAGAGSLAKQAEPPGGGYAEGVLEVARSAGVEGEVLVFDGWTNDVLAIGRRKTPGRGRLFVSDRLLADLDRPAARALLATVAHRMRHRYRLASLLPYYVAPVEVLVIVSLVPSLYEEGLVSDAAADAVVFGALLAGVTVAVGLRAYARRLVFAADDHAADLTDPATAAGVIERAGGTRSSLRRRLALRPDAETRAARLRDRAAASDGESTDNGTGTGTPAGNGVHAQ